MPTTQPAGEPGQSATVPSADGQADRLAGQPHADLGSPPPAMAGVSQLAKLVAAVVAPTTLLTSLLFFFGWSRAYWFYDYFGVHSTLLGLTTQDYVQQSLDGLSCPSRWPPARSWWPCGPTPCCAHGLPAAPAPRLLRVLLAALVGGGLALTVAGLWSVVATTVLSRHLAAAPISLAVGVVLLVYAAHLWRSIGARGAGAAPPRAAWLAIAEWAGVFVLVGLSLFWAANDYSAAVGRSRARQFVAELPIYPQRRDLQRAKPQPTGARGPRGPLPGPGGRLPVPLRRPQAGPAVRRPVPVPPRGLDAPRRGRDPHAPQRRPPPGVHPGVGSPNHPGRGLLRPAPRRPAVPGRGAPVAAKLNLLYI